MAAQLKYLRITNTQANGAVVNLGSATVAATVYGGIGTATPVVVSAANGIISVSYDPVAGGNAKVVVNCDTGNILGLEAGDRYREVDFESISQQVAQVVNNCFGTVWHVSPNGNDSNDGLSWATAKFTPSSLTPAVGDAVWLAPGIYSSAATLQITADCKIAGSGAGASMIACTSDSADALDVAGNVVLEDLTVQDAVVGSERPIYLNSGTLTIRRCQLFGYADVISGLQNGGLRIEDSYLSATEDCIAGSGDSYTGTLFLRNVTIVVSGDATHGGSAASPRLTPMVAVNCAFHAYNSSSAVGSNGVVGSAVTLINCTITAVKGKGLCLDAGSGTITCYGCTFDRTNTNGTIIDLPLSDYIEQQGALAALQSTAGQQAARDAMKLAPTAGSPASGSIDAQLGAIPTNPLQTNDNRLPSTTIAAQADVASVATAATNASNYTGQFPAIVVAKAPTAIATQCQVGTIAPGRIEIHQGSAFVLPGTGSPVSISVVDQNQNPINLAGRTVELIATSPADTSTVLWRWTTAAGGGLTIVGPGSNVIQINADSTNSQTAGDFELFAWDITNGASNAIPEAHCRLSIKAAPQP